MVILIHVTLRNRDLDLSEIEGLGIIAAAFKFIELMPEAAQGFSSIYLP